MTISALANIDRLKLSENVKGFFDWWWRELRAVVPRSIENWFGDDAVYILVRMDGDQAHLWLCSGDDEQVLGDYDLSGDGDLNDNGGLDIESLRQTVLQNISENTHVEVELAEQRVLSSVIFLPMATEQTLNQVIRFEMDRFTPFKVDQVGYSCTILERIPERDKLKVELNVVRRDYLVELLAGLAEFGLNVSAVFIKQPANTLNNASTMKHHTQRLAAHSNFTRLNLLPADLLPGRTPLWDKRTKNLLAGFLILLGIVITLPNYLQSSRIESLEAEIATINANAITAGEKQRLLIAHLEGQDILVNMKNDQSAKLENIRVLTELLPDTTWVSKLVIDGTNISIQGESTKSSDLIGMLERTKHFTNVAFASPVTRNAATNMERYEIRMQLVGLEPEREAGVLEGTTKTGGAKP